MSINVKIPTALSQYTNGQRSVQADGADLAGLLVDLDQRYPGLRARLIADDGKLRRFVNLCINDGDIHAGRFLESELADGDTVSILMAVAGG